MAACRQIGAFQAHLCILCSQIYRQGPDQLQQALFSLLIQIVSCCIDQVLIGSAENALLHSELPDEPLERWPSGRRRSTGNAV